MRPDVEAIVAARRRHLPDGDRPPPGQVLGQLSLAWGIGLLSLPPSAPPARVVDARRRLDRARPTTAPALGRPASPITVHPAAPDTGEPVRDVVLEAAAAVVARTGFERATVSRIARRAGYSTGVIYEYYERKDDMIAELVEVLLETLYETIAERDGELHRRGPAWPTLSGRPARRLRAARGPTSSSG